MPTTPLKKLNEIIAGLLSGQTYYATLGSVSSDSVWAAAVPKILNGNTLLCAAGPAANQVTVKASSVVLNVSGGPGVRELNVPTNYSITSILTPGLARNDGTNYFFSQHDPFDEAVVLLAGYYNHLYVCWDTTKGNFTALGVIATPTPAAPSASTVATFISDNSTASARQMMCYVNASGQVTLMQGYPAMFSSLASVAADANPSLVDWKLVAHAGVGTNAFQVIFTFPAGVATGAVGEVAIRLGGDIVAYLPISPQLLKDSDIEFVVKWNVMVGEPGAFI